MHEATSQSLLPESTVGLASVGPETELSGRLTKISNPRDPSTGVTVALDSFRLKLLVTPIMHGFKIV